MNVLTTTSIAKTLDVFLQKEDSIHLSVNSNISAESKPDVLVGYYSDLKSFNQNNHKPIIILIVSKTEDLQSNDFLSLSPNYIIDDTDFKGWARLIVKIKDELSKNKLSKAIRSEVEEKRETLEKLNSFLMAQDEERGSALKVFISEENKKRNEEKKLLYFLDFINSVYPQPDFIDQLILFLKDDIKKNAISHQLGIILLKKDQTTHDWFYQDVKNDLKHNDLTTSFEAGFTSVTLNQFMANFLRRPVGKIILWENNSSAEKFYFYIEVLGQDVNLTELDAYVSQRLSAMALAVSRKLTEFTQEVLLSNWRRMFDSTQEPTHVIDVQFNLIQSSYAFYKSDRAVKCHSVLAKRDTPCIDCPAVLKKQKGLVNIDNKNFEYSMTEFTVMNNPYFLIFYKDKTVINSLKTEYIQSEKMNTIGHLANHLTHELNNPLTGLKMSAQFILDDVGDEVTLTNDLKEILKATERSETIIKDLSEFTKVKEIYIEKVNFNKLVQKTLVLLKSITRKSKIFIDIKDRDILASFNHLQQVVFNLIKNASEASQEKTTIKIYEVVHNHYIDYVFEDNGPGVDIKNQDQLFKPFFTTKKEGDGTGLGLYLSSQLLQKMNGELIFDSTYKSGARFILRFKL